MIGRRRFDTNGSKDGQSPVDFFAIAKTSVTFNARCGAAMDRTADSYLKAKVVTTDQHIGQIVASPVGRIVRFSGIIASEQEESK